MINLVFPLKSFIKYRQKDLIRSMDGIPTSPVKASRPTQYKPILSGGSGPKKIMNQGQARASQISNPNRLKIISGTAKGKKLESPSVYLRPMMAKVTYVIYSSSSSSSSTSYTLHHLRFFLSLTV